MTDHNSVPDPNPDPDPPVPHVLGLPDPDPLVRVMDPDPDPSIIKNATIVRKTLIPTILWTIFDFLSLKNDVNVPSKSNKQKKLC